MSTARAVCLSLLLAAPTICMGAAAPAEPLKIVVLAAVSNAPVVGLSKAEARTNPNAERIKDFSDAISWSVRNRPQFAPVKFLEPAEQTADESTLQHLALLDLMVADLANQNPMAAPRDPAKLKHTVGPGLASAADRYGVEHGLLARLDDPSMTAGRTAAELVNTAITLWASGGMAASFSGPMPRMTVALVELRSGRIVWVADKYPLDWGLGREAMFEYADSLLCQYPQGNRVAPSKLRRACGRDVGIGKDGEPEWDDD